VNAGKSGFRDDAPISPGGADIAFHVCAAPWDARDFADGSPAALLPGTLFRFGDGSDAVNRGGPTGRAATPGTQTRH